MAKNKSTTALGSVQRTLSALHSLCEVVHDANPADPPPWVHIVWHLVKEAETACEQLHRSGADA